MSERIFFDNEDRVRVPKGAKIAVTPPNPLPAGSDKDSSESFSGGGGSEGPASPEVQEFVRRRLADAAFDRESAHE